MTKFVQVVATVEEAAIAAVAVTGAPGGAGDAVVYTTQSSAATLSNTSRGCDVQYKVGGGAWTDLERGCGIDLAIDFSTTSLYLRRSTLDGGPATCSLSIDGMPVVRVANQILGGAGAPSSLAPVSLSANTTLTRAAHYNRLIVVDVSGGNVTLTATGTDALLGDFISVDVIGGGSNTVTLAGVTAQSGYQLTAISGGNVEARCDVAASFIASTRTIPTSTGGDATIALVDGDFTSNNLNLVAAKTNCVLDLTAVTIPTTITIQTDAAGGYDTTSCKLRVLAGTVAPVAIIAGSSATVIGGVQVVEQGSWGGAQRTSTNTWVTVKQQNNLSTSTRMSKRGSSIPAGVLATGINNIGLSAPTAIDSSTVGAAGGVADGITEYGTLRRVRYTSAAAAINRVAGHQASLSARLEGKDSVFPVSIAGAIADNIVTAPYAMGICSTTSFNMLSTEPSASTADLLLLGADSGDANMQIIHKGVSAATKLDLGAAFPKSQFVAYGLTIYKNNAGTAFLVVAENMNTDVFAVKIITTNPPRNTLAYHHVQARSSWNDAASSKVDFIGFEIGVGS